MIRKGRWSRTLVILSLIAGCASDQPIHSPEHEHEEMTEASEPIAHSVESGPVAEGIFTREEIADLDIVDGSFITDQLILPATASRASIWFTLENDVPTPEIWVQAGWENGQTGPWTALSEVWAEKTERVVATGLDTAASRLRFRIATAEASEVLTIRWAANVPLRPEDRDETLPHPVTPPDSVVGPCEAWQAKAPRCGTEDTPNNAVIYRVPGPAEGQDVPLFLRALQAFDQDGLQWCNVRANYLIDASDIWMGRGTRRGALGATARDNVGTIAIAVLGCGDENSAAIADHLALVLDELTARHGLASADKFATASAGCDDSEIWLEDTLADWLETAPFVEVDPPTVEDATLSGRIYDASTGGATDGVGLTGAVVNCDCGPSSTSGSDGGWSMAVPAGTHTLTVSKDGFVDASLEISVTAGEDWTFFMGLDPLPVEPPDDLVSVIDHAFLIRRFGGTSVDPTVFDETQDGFQAYLDAVGVTYFAAWEYVVPNNASVAADCGYSILLPERAWWPKAAALGLLADQLRGLVNEPVTLRNWWRPPCYNSGVGGAANGDHPDADALDLDFNDARSRADAQRHLCETYWNQDIVAPDEIAPGSNLNPRLNMSIGLGGVTIHLGLLSSNGRRFWKYGSYTELEESGNCW